MLDFGQEFDPDRNITFEGSARIAELSVAQGKNGGFGISLWPLSMLFFQALQSTLRCLALLYRYVSNVTERRLLDVLQKHSVLRNLRVLLAFLLEVRQRWLYGLICGPTCDAFQTGYFDTSLLCTVCLLFTLTAKSLESLSLIRYSGFLEWICVDLIMAPKVSNCGFYAFFPPNDLSFQAIVYDMDVLSALFAVHIAILEAGTHHAVPACAAFVASYSDMVVQV